MAITGARADNGTITPHLMVRGGRKAIEFYTRAFGATVLYQSTMPFSDGVRAHLRIGKTMVMVTDEQPPGPNGVMTVERRSRSAPRRRFSRCTSTMSTPCISARLTPGRRR